MQHQIKLKGKRHKLFKISLGPIFQEDFRESSITLKLEKRKKIGPKSPVNISEKKMISRFTNKENRMKKKGLNNNYKIKNLNLCFGCIKASGS